MNIVLFGPPGAGKGTQADNLVNEFNLIKISTGELLRSEVEKKSELGNQIKSIIDSGSLISDDIIDKLIENLLSDSNSTNRIIFDGYPRNLNQAKNLDKILKKNKQKISAVISLNVEENLVIKRVMGREICSKCGLTFNKFFKPSSDLHHKCDPKFLKKRADDNENAIKKRFKIYVDETLPILDYYKNQNLLTIINGMNKIDVIYEEIREFIASLKT